MTPPVVYQRIKGIIAQTVARRNRRDRPVSNTVEPAAVRAYPQETVAGLQDGVDRAVRQATLLVPDVMNVLRDGFVWIETLRRDPLTGQAEHARRHHPDDH